MELPKMKCQDSKTLCSILISLYAEFIQRFKHNFSSLYMYHNRIQGRKNELANKTMSTQTN